ncbi:MAG: glucoamylase family protein [Candidatus Omnitrophota bacterium]|nr:glucoamylase family protein [Candidatus Omnitrophota bacterium]
MRNKTALLLALLLMISNAANCLSAQPRVEITTTEEDTKYLWALAKDTWTNINFYVAPETGFPYDTDQKADFTNTTNIGLYLTSLAAATEMGFIPREEAAKKADKILDSLAKLEHWNGFFNNWINVKGITKATEGINAVSDFNKLPAGLIITRQQFPELRDKCAALLDRMNWSIFYNPNAKKFYGGYDVVKKQMSTWNMDLLAADTRLASFLVIATGAAPAEVWNSLRRDTEEHYGLKIIVPSWYGGGIFMQGICGLFLDERETIMGKSMADFAYAQMLYAREVESPVWGWSSSTSPSGDYLGWGGLRGNVVTPHASALAITYYPNKVVENFKNLEKYGLRSEFETSGKRYAFGFRDAVDIDSREVANAYLTALDQGMLFLSLANYLKDGLVWKTFEKDPIVRRGKELLKDYFSPHPEYREIYNKRDTTPFEPLRRGESINLAPLIVEDYFVIDYDLGSAKPVSFSKDLNSTDISRYNALSFNVMGDKDSRYTHSFRIEMEGKSNGAVYKLRGVTDKWQKLIIPLREFGGANMSHNPTYSYWGGFITDRTKMKKISFDFELSQVSEGKGKIYIGDLGFEHLDNIAFQQTALSLNNFADSPVWNGDTLDDFGTKAGWSQGQSQGAFLNFNLVPGKEGNAMELDYNLGSDGQTRWVVVEKDMYLTLPGKYAFKFFVKSEGDTNVLEFKLIDTNSSTFGKKLPIPSTNGEWKEITLESSDISYLWGGDRKLDRIRRISIAISAKSGGKGKILINKLRFLKPSILAFGTKTP